MYQKSILLVDDSPFFATTLGRYLSQLDATVVVVHTQDEGMELLSNGDFQIVIWDIMMLNGPSLMVLQLEIQNRPLLLLRSTPTEALRWQSMDPETHPTTQIVAKPSTQEQMLAMTEQVCTELSKVGPDACSGIGVMARDKIRNRQITERPKVIGIAVSTGGPPVLERILSMLPEDFSVPILIVQHISPGFMDTFRQWLADRVVLPVYLGIHGAELTRGIWLAPDAVHMKVERRRIVIDSETPPVQYAKPSGDVLLESLGQVYGYQALGIVLTGLGRDGADGMQVIQSNGGRTLVQERVSCTISGMVRATLKGIQVDAELTPEQIATYLCELNR